MLYLVHIYLKCCNFIKVNIFSGSKKDFTKTICDNMVYVSTVCTYTIILFPIYIWRPSLSFHWTFGRGGGIVSISVRNRPWIIFCSSLTWHQTNGRDIQWFLTTRHKCDDKSFLQIYVYLFLVTEITEVRLCYVGSYTIELQNTLVIKWWFSLERWRY